MTDDGWVPAACTLPTEEQPVRQAEFDRLFTEAVRGVDRVAPGRLRLFLDPQPSVAARVAELVVRETACCSFFTFTLRAGGGEVVLQVDVPDGYAGVLSALAARTGGAP